MTITEALAEIKTIEKRIVSKRDFVTTNLFRLDSLKDPHEKDGGSAKVLDETLQAIRDLEDRIVKLRLSIQTANETNTITLTDETKSIADWLVWRREVAPGKERFLKNLRVKLNSAREAVRTQQRSSTYGMGSTPITQPLQDILVHIDEKKLQTDSENLEKILGDLDGQLSLKNATIMVTV